MPMVAAMPVAAAGGRGVGRQPQGAFANRSTTVLGLGVLLLGAATLLWQAIERTNTPVSAFPQSLPRRYPPTSHRQPFPPPSSSPSLKLRQIPGCAATGAGYCDGFQPWNDHIRFGIPWSWQKRSRSVAIPVKRMNSTRGAASVAWTIESGSARPNVDYRPVSENVVRFIEGQVRPRAFSYRSWKSGEPPSPEVPARSYSDPPETDGARAGKLRNR